MASNCRSRTSETLTLDAEPHPSNGDYSSISVSLIIDCTGCAISSDLYLHYPCSTAKRDGTRSPRRDGWSGVEWHQREHTRSILSLVPVIYSSYIHPHANTFTHVIVPAWHPHRRASSYVRARRLLRGFRGWAYWITRSLDRENIPRGWQYADRRFWKDLPGSSGRASYPVYVST